MHTEKKSDFINILQQDHNLTDSEIIAGIKKYMLHKDTHVSPEIQESWQLLINFYAKQKFQRRTLRRQRSHRPKYKRRKSKKYSRTKKKY